MHSCNVFKRIQNISKLTSLTVILLKSRHSFFISSQPWMVLMFWSPAVMKLWFTEPQSPEKIHWLEWVIWLNVVGAVTVPISLGTLAFASCRLSPLQILFPAVLWQDFISCFMPPNSFCFWWYLWKESSSITAAREPCSLWQKAWNWEWWLSNSSPLLCIAAGQT